MKKIKLIKRKDIAKVAKEIVFNDYECPYCGRTVPNFSHLTKNQCLWCDAEYWQKKMSKLDLNK